MDADVYARKLREKPFWRFRRRQALGKALADARLREQEAMRLLDGQGDGASGSLRSSEDAGADSPRQ